MTIRRSNELLLGEPHPRRSRRLGVAQPIGFWCLDAAPAAVMRQFCSFMDVPSRSSHWQFDPDEPTGLLPDLHTLRDVFPGGPVSLSRWMLRDQPGLDG